MKPIWPLFFSILSSFSQAALDPIELRAKVFAMYLSKSAYCDSPITVFAKDTVIQYDVFGFPVLGVADNSTHSFDGTYECIIFKLSEQFQFLPSVTATTCIFPNRYFVDVCTASYQNTEIDGSTSSCSSATDESVYLYLSTASNSNDPDVALQPFSPPTPLDSSKGIKLSSSFSVTGKVGGRLVINGINRINAGGGTCTMAMPKFSFVKE